MANVNQSGSNTSRNPSTPSDGVAAPEVPLSFAAWLRGNALGLLMVFGAVATLWVYLATGRGWTPDEVLEFFWNVLKVALGLGFVIFIHELGHFAVAKWCDVHVETFSIGFGPALPGCLFQKGETTYKISLFPLGGYVKMLGENDGESEEDDDNPRSFKNKPVGQRMAIISAGVIMNVLSGFLFFAWVYLGYGEWRQEALISSVDPGSPAWEKGVRSDSHILKIGDIENPYTDDFRLEVMTTSAGDRIPLVYTPAKPEGQVIEVDLEPRREKHNRHPMIGVVPSGPDLQLVEKRRRLLTPVMPGSAASKAEPAFAFGDLILGISDPNDPSKIVSLRDGEDGREKAHVRYRNFRRHLQKLAGKEILVQVRRADSSEVVAITVPPAYYSTLGLRMRMGHVTDVREDSPAQRVGIQVPNPEKNQEGDIIKWVQVTEADGSKLLFAASPLKEKELPPGAVPRELDPVRLPWELRQWADRTPGKKKVTLHVLRKTGNGMDHVTQELDWDELRQFDQELPSHLQSPLSIPALGLAYRIETFVDGVAPGSPAERAGIQRGDVIKAVRFQVRDRKPGEYTWDSWQDLASNQWAHVAVIFQELESKTVGLRVESVSETREVELTGEPDEAWPRADRGWYLDSVEYLQTAEGSFLKALALGFNKTTRTIKMIYLHLKGMLFGDISPKTIGGPILIARVAYDFAGQGFYEFLMFLALISVNLAVINFLPIPLLDGGHMVFLIYEKLRGKPASERVMWIAMILGIALIATIFLFASYQDILRLLGIRD